MGHRDLGDAWVLAYFIGDPRPWHFRASPRSSGGGISLGVTSDLHTHELPSRSIVVDHEGTAWVQALLFGKPGRDAAGAAEGHIFVWFTPIDHLHILSERGDVWPAVLGNFTSISVPGLSTDAQVERFLEGMSPADLEARWELRTLRVRLIRDSRLVFELEKITDTRHASPQLRNGHLEVPVPWIVRPVNPPGCRGGQLSVSGMLQLCAAWYGRRHLWEAIGLNRWSPSLTAEGAWEARLAPASHTDG